MTPLLAILKQRLRQLAPQRRTPTRIVDLGTPDHALYAIGDVHGCRAELAHLLTLIEQDAAGIGQKPMAILLGDLVDRGPDSAGVLDLVARRSGDGSLVALLGNHERMMLDFLDNPHAGADWLDLGGFETLRSYGLSLTRADLSSLSPRRARQRIDAHLPAPHLDVLRALPHGFRATVDGQPFVLTHAGYDPTRPPEAQREATVLWGHHSPRLVEGPRLVQGHEIVDRPDPAAHRIHIDTGAWRSGRLTALRLCPGHPPLLISTAPAPGQHTVHS
jgi:serine/threonine protein phosphatase 1